MPNSRACLHPEMHPAPCLFNESVSPFSPFHHSTGQPPARALPTDSETRSSARPCCPLRPESASVVFVVYSPSVFSGSTLRSALCLHRLTSFLQWPRTQPHFADEITESQRIQKLSQGFTVRSKARRSSKARALHQTNLQLPCPCSPQA